MWSSPYLCLRYYVGYRFRSRCGMRCVRCWAKYRFLVYPVSCLILMTATAYAVYTMTGEYRQLVSFSLVTDKQTLPPITPTHSMVLVVAYMRSGSSFLGDILQQDDSSFYVYEPLKDANDRIENNQSIALYNGTNRYVHTPEEKISFFVESLYNWFTCNFKDLDIGTLTSSYLLHYSKKTRNYMGCLTRHHNKMDGVEYCLQYLQSTCIPAKLRVIKSIRINMDTVHLLQQRLPFLKVIHVVRDPRGIMNSRVKVKLSNWINLSSEVNNLCRRMTKNIEMSTLDREENVKQIVYELLAEHPIALSEDLYNFAGLEFSPTVSKRVYKMTHYSPHARDCDWCTKKSNSSMTSLMWRTEIELEHAEVIDSQCVDLYNMIGYLPVQSLQQLRNHSVPLHLKILPPGLL
ncbi:carbohydrate sulfotransferase 6-like [Ylistrum balloti]|uniref:carbohydrate sulfotransferase 6-like n=1 Tax=Ylistrum balloti TaxID=509963 RepID=UPI002905CFF3|nr:carbohydrate sulfotransferase 6-like [Ylistrum balloti]